MRILLAFPDVESPYGKPRYPPLSLCYLGASLLKAGYEVRALDMRIYKNSSKVLQETLEEFKPDVVGTTATSFSFNAATGISRVAKEFSKDIITITGGPHITIVPDELKSHSEIDYGFIGDGEGPIVEIISAIEKGKDFRHIPGLVYRNGDKVVQNPSVLSKELDKLPFPAFQLFPLDKYRARGVLKLPIMTSRGCPYGCIYCCSHKIFGRGFRPRSPENVVAELERDIKEFGTHTFTIIDDLFTFDQERVIEICNLIIKKKLNLDWSCDQGVRADRSSLEVFKKMKESGCKLIALGVESGNDRVLVNLNKGETLADMERAIGEAREAGLIVKASFIIGSPGDTPKTVQDSIDFFKKNNIDIPRFNMMIPYPGTKLWEWMGKNSNVLIDPHNFVLEYSTWKNIGVVYDTPDFPKEERERMYALADLESERWILKNQLEKRLGKRLGGILYKPMKNRLIIRALIFLYQNKVVSVYG